MPRIFTIDAQNKARQHLEKADDRLAALFRLVGDLSYSLYEDPYTFMIETIVAQMLSNKVADVMVARLRNACGGDIHPQPVSRLAVQDLRACGLSNAKANAILGLTAQVLEGSLDFANIENLPDDEVVRLLTGLRGIGMWSAKMYLIFVLDREDVLPFEDVAFLQAYAWLYQTDQTGKKDIVARCEPWKPHASTAARYLYRALDMGLTKTPSGDTPEGETGLPQNV